MAPLTDAQPSSTSPNIGARERAARFCRRFGLRVPILQAPMAGACPTSLASAVANAGGMGGLGALMTPPDGIARWVREFRDQSNGGFQINLWIPDPPPVRDPEHERKVRDFLEQWGAAVPAEAGDAAPLDFSAQCEALLAAGPRVVSSIMGLSPEKFVASVRRAESPGSPARRLSVKPAPPKQRAPTPSLRKVRRRAGTAARSMPPLQSVNPFGDLAKEAMEELGPELAKEAVTEVGTDMAKEAL